MIYYSLSLSELCFGKAKRGNCFLIFGLSRCFLQKNSVKQDLLHKVLQHDEWFYVWRSVRGQKSYLDQVVLYSVDGVILFIVKMAAHQHQYQWETKNDWLIWSISFMSCNHSEELPFPSFKPSIYHLWRGKEMKSVGKEWSCTVYI